MKTCPFDEKQAHKWFAGKCNNRAWDLADTEKRCDAQNQEMLHSAHTAFFHWSQIGNVAQKQRATVLLARVYSELKLPNIGLEYALAALKLAEQHSSDMEDWDWAFIYENIARNYFAVGENALDAREYLQKAVEAGKKIEDQEDKEVFVAGFKKGNWHGENLDSIEI